MAHILQKESYLAMIRNAEGANIFRNLYVMIEGKPEDILKDGKRSCAVFVSSVLCQFKLVSSAHATVAGLERDLEQSGWRRVDTPQLGDVLVWEPKLQGETESSHAGFYLGGDKAISNNWNTRVPEQHHFTYGTNKDGTPARRLTAIYTHDFVS